MCVKADLDAVWLSRFREPSARYPISLPRPPTMRKAPTGSSSFRSCIGQSFGPIVPAGSFGAASDCRCCAFGYAALSAGARLCQRARSSAGHEDHNPIRGQAF
jgi:hypothetical protein